MKWNGTYVHSIGSILCLWQKKQAFKRLISQVCSILPVAHNLNCSLLHKARASIKLHTDIALKCMTHYKHKDGIYQSLNLFIIHTRAMHIQYSTKQYTSIMNIHYSTVHIMAHVRKATQVGGGSLHCSSSWQVTMSTPLSENPSSHE